MSQKYSFFTMVYFLLACLLCVNTASVFALSNTQDDQTVLRTYLTGNGLLNRGMYELAAKEYRKFLTEHKDHEKAPMARYGLSVSIFRLKEYKEAAKQLEQISDDPKFEFAAEVGLLLGQSYVAMKDYKSAIKPLDKVIKLHSKHSVADDAAALLVESLYKEKQYDKIVEPLKFIKRIHPDSPYRDRIELFGGLSAMAQQEYPDAINRLEGMLKRSPENSFATRARLMLARCYHQSDDLKKAAVEYRNVIETKDKEFLPDALYSLGSIQRRNNQTKDAGQLLDRLIKEFPKCHLILLARFERGRAWFDLNNYNKALEQFNLVADSKSDRRDSASYWAAKCELRNGDAAKASTRLEQAIAKYPKSKLLPEMIYDRAIALLRTENNREAVKVIVKFRKQYPKHEMSAEALHLLAGTTHQLGDYTASAKYCDDFQKNFRSSQLLTSIDYLAAENDFLDGNLEDAVERYKSFLARHAGSEQTDNAEFRLGTALYRLDKLDEAEQHLRAVARSSDTNPEFKSVLLALGDIQFSNKKWNTAADLLMDYLSFGSDSPNADDALLKLGLARHRENKYEQALKAYDRLLKEFDDSPHKLQATFERGQALVKLEKPEEAARAFEATLELEENSRFASHALHHLASIAMRNNDYTKASEYYSQLAKADIDDDTRAESLFQQGQALMAQEQYKQAGDVFASALTQYPDHNRTPVVTANHALCLARQGLHQDALTAINKVENTVLGQLEDELHISLAYEKAWCQRELGDENAAIESYREMLKQPNDNKLGQYARVELAELEATAEHYEEAGELLRPLLRKEDQLPADLYERIVYRFGVCEFELERYKTAASAFEEFLKEHPKSELALSASLLCGESLFALKKHQQAVIHLARVVKEGRKEKELHSPALLRLGESEAALQHWDKSHTAFADYLKLYPESKVWFQAQFGIGWALENKSKHDDAIAAYKNVAEKHKGPTAARSQFQIGECLFAMKKYEDAIVELLKVDFLYAYPEWSAAALYEAGRCFESLAQTAQAKTQFEQVRDKYSDTQWAKLATKRLSALTKTSLPGRGGK